MNTPLFYITICYAGGIIIGTKYNLSLLYSAIAFLIITAVILMFFLIHQIKLKQQQKYEMQSGIQLDKIQERATKETKHLLLSQPSKFYTILVFLFTVSLSLFSVGVEEFLLKNEHFYKLLKESKKIYAEVEGVVISFPKESSIGNYCFVLKIKDLQQRHSVQSYTSRGYSSSNLIDMNDLKEKNKREIFISTSDELKKAKSYHSNLLVVVPQKIKKSLFAGNSAKSKFYRGDLLKVKGIISFVPNISNYRKNNIYSICKVSEIKKVGSSKVHFFYRFADFIRDRLINVLEQTLPLEQSSIVKSLVFGDKGSLLPGVIENFRRSGILHLTVVSGTHINILISSILLITLFLRRDQSFLVLIILPFIFFYGLICEASYSILRALIMGTILLFSMVFTEKYDGISALSVSAIIIMVINPFSVFDIGFQLSFSAAWGILFLYPILRNISYFVKSSIIKLLLLSLSAQIGILPVQVYHYGTIYPFSLFTNLIATPVSSFIIIIGLCTVLLGSLIFYLGWIGSTLLLPFIYLLSFSAYLVASIPFSELKVGYISSFAVLLLYLCIFSGGNIFKILMNRYLQAVFTEEDFNNKKKDEKNKKLINKLFIWCSILFLLINILVWQDALKPAPKWTRVTFINVGQGDAIYISTAGKNGKNVLIDGGNIEGAYRFKSPRYYQKSSYRFPRIITYGNRLKDFIVKNRIKYVDYIVCTHPDDDHIGGLLWVVKNVGFGAIIDLNISFSSPIYDEFKKEIGKKKVKLITGRKGMEIKLNEYTKMEIIHPTDTFIKVHFENLNDCSIVIKLIIGKISFLLTGDLEEGGENYLIRNYEQMGTLKCDILKVGHHGSKTSTSEEFLREVKPKIGIISVGSNNPFGLPDKEVIFRLQQVGAKIHRTDEDGDITFITDGVKFEIK